MRTLCALPYFRLGPKTRSPLSKLHVRFSREQTLVAPAGQARCFLFANGRGSAKPVNRIVSGVTFCGAVASSDQNFGSCGPGGAPRLAAAGNRHAVPAENANHR